MLTLWTQFALLLYTLKNLPVLPLSFVPLRKPGDHSPLQPASCLLIQLVSKEAQLWQVALRQRENGYQGLLAFGAQPGLISFQIKSYRNAAIDNSALLFACFFQGPKKIRSDFADFSKFNCSLFTVAQYNSLEARNRQNLPMHVAFLGTKMLDSSSVWGTQDLTQWEYMVSWTSSPQHTSFLHTLEWEFSPYPQDKEKRQGIKNSHSGLKWYLTPGL